MNNQILDYNNSGRKRKSNKNKENIKDDSQKQPQLIDPLTMSCFSDVRENADYMLVNMAINDIEQPTQSINLHEDMNKKKPTAITINLIPNTKTSHQINSLKLIMILNENKIIDQPVRGIQQMLTEPSTSEEVNEPSVDTTEPSTDVGPVHTILNKPSLNDNMMVVMDVEESTDNVAFSGMLSHPIEFSSEAEETESSAMPVLTETTQMRGRSISDPILLELSRDIAKNTVDMARKKAEVSFSVGLIDPSVAIEVESKSLDEQSNSQVELLDKDKLSDTNRWQTFNIDQIIIDPESESSYIQQYQNMYAKLNESDQLNYQEPMDLCDICSSTIKIDAVNNLHILTVSNATITSINLLDAYVRNMYEMDLHDSSKYLANIFTDLLSILINSPLASSLKFSALNKDDFNTLNNLLNKARCNEGSS